MLKHLLLRLYCGAEAGFTSVDRCLRALEPWEGHTAESALGRLMREPELQTFFKAPGNRDPLAPCPRIGQQLAARGIKPLCRWEEGYPALLREAPDAPLLLFYQGLLPNPDSLSVGMVGARRSTPAGLQTAREIAAQLAAGGVSVISGLAEGADTAAHEGALSVGGYTLAVLGSGLNQTYPASNQRLRRRILEGGGGILSEFPPDLPARTWNFPRRNRIISGLSAGVLITEASLRSGSLITARYALEQGRDLFAVPGSVRSPVSQGTNQLIKEGAVPVTEGGDIFCYYALSPAAPAPAVAETPGLEPGELKVVRLLEAQGALTVDLLAALSREPVPRLLGLLAGLEIKGAVERWITGEYCAKKR